MPLTYAHDVKLSVKTEHNYIYIFTSDRFIILSEQSNIKNIMKGNAPGEKFKEK